jgi:hypothetical protein
MSSYTFNPSTSFNPSSGVGYTFGSGGTSGATTTASSGSRVGNFFKSSSGQNIISQGVGALFSFGLSAFGSNQARQDLKAQANIVAQQGQSQLAVAQEGTKQAQLALEAAKLQGSGAGGNIALYVGLGIAGVVVLGVVIFAVTRRS